MQTSTASASQLSSSSAIANLLLDSNKQPVTHPDWEEKRPASPQPPAATSAADVTITSSPSTSRTRTRSSVSFSLSAQPASSTASASASATSRTERHRRRRAQRGSPASSPIFTPAELSAQKAKRSSWLAEKESSLQAQRDAARKEKEQQGNRWLLVVLLLWMAVIVVIVGCVGRSLWEGQGRQQLRLRPGNAYRPAVEHGRSERITSMLERDW